MFFICNNSLLFDPEAKTISIVGQPESVLTLSMPAVRLLQEFIKNRRYDLSREELITRVWDNFGFKPSGSNLNRAVSELRKSFHILGDNHEFIVTVPRFGFRFDADVIVEDVIPELTQQPFENSSGHTRSTKKLWLVLAVLITSTFLGGWEYSRQFEITIPATLIPVKEKIAGCRIWLINDNSQPLVLSKMAELLKKNKVACEREDYNIYYLSTSFSIHAANEEFVGACPVSKTSLCKTIRYKSGT